MTKIKDREPARRWLARLLAGERAALARAITAVENDGAEAREVLAAIRPRLGRALVVGVTGAPGTGKSTLTGAYIGALRRQGRRVGVVAVDPSSPVSGGALLGDRIRMTEHAADEHVFVRSLAARGHLGGLARNAARVVDVMDAAGNDVVIVETVGTGQSEIEIAGLARVRLVVIAPGLGDDVQALKAGILEIADILVLNKSDQPHAARAARRLERLVAPGSGARVLRTVATTGEGVAELAEAVEAVARAPAADTRRESPRERARRLIAATAAERVRDALDALDDAGFAALCDALARGEIDLPEATKRALTLIAREKR
ncbi:MAG: methylmalonyl Co-A mutase-associated GTPase MeaB [Alphaproteobacteria bacterium]